MKNITLLGIDLAKDVFQLHGVNEYGKKILGKKVSRSALPTLIANMPGCKIVMEACGSSNYWSRKFMSYGHTVSQISPQHVKPFVQGNKNDKNDKPVPEVKKNNNKKKKGTERSKTTNLANDMNGFLKAMEENEGEIDVDKLFGF